MADDPRVLVVDDDDTFRRTICRELGHMGFQVSDASDGQAAVDAVKQEAPDVVLLDVRMPKMDGLKALQAIKAEAEQTQAVMLTGQGTVEDAVKALKTGAYDYLLKPCSLDKLEVTIRRAFEKSQLLRQNSLLRARLARQERPGGIVGSSPAIEAVMETAERVAGSDSTVLIHGESGVGKELVAEAIHAWSPRADRPFVVIDCTSLQENLLESELFGHERGAYTSATALKHGLFEVADTGTILLDEVGELTPGIQAKLLRVLESGTFRRVGGTESIHVDVRVIAATNRDLQQLVEEFGFRRDLFFRLHVVSIEVPPLRDRREDIPLLVRHFLGLAQRDSESPHEMSEEALELLMAHGWPGNVRELQNAVDRSVLMARAQQITAADLPEELQPRSGSRFHRGGRLTTLREAEHRHIEHVLRQVDGHRGRAASILGLSERQLYRKIRDHGL